MFSKKSIKIILAIYILFMAFCLIAGIASTGKVKYSSDENKVISAYSEKRTIAGGISLTPGIYKTIVTYEGNTSSLYGGFLNVRDLNVRARGLECTGCPLYQGLNEASADFMFLDSTETFEVLLDTYENEYTVTSVKIVNTGKLYSVSAISATFVFLGILLIYVFSTLISEKKISNERIISILILCGVFVLMILPMLYQNSLSTPDDGYHRHRIEGIAAALKSFQFPVRIEPQWLQGYGYADAIFYCPIFLLFPALLRLSGFSLTAAYNFYYVSISAITIIIAFYAFKNIFKKEATALVTTVLHSVAVMHFFKFILIGGVGEGTAIAFLPLVLLGAFRIFILSKEKGSDKEASRGILDLALGVTGLIFCHILSVEITIGVLLVLFLINVFNKKGGRIFVRSAVAALISLLLTAWFVVPFLEYYICEDIFIKHASARTIQERGLYLPQIIMTFFGSGKGYEPEMGMCQSDPSGIGIVLFIGLIIFTVLWAKKVFVKSGKNTLGKQSFIMAIVMIILSLRIFPWDAIQSMNGLFASLISSIQFPHRFLEWGVLFAIITIGCSMDVFIEADKKKLLYGIYSLTFASVAFVFVYASDANLKDIGKYYIANPEGIGTGYIAGAEYLPNGTDINALTYNKVSAGEGISVSNFVPGSLKGSMHVENASGAESYVEFPLLNYRGYKAYGNGQKLTIVNGDNNVIRVIVPANFNGDVSVKFVSPIHWRLAEVISLLGAICLAVLCIRRKKFFKVSNAENEETSISRNIKEEAEYSLAGVDGLETSIVNVLAAALTFVLVLFPYLGGYVINGTYINEMIMPFTRITEATGIKASYIFVLCLSLLVIVSYVFILHMLKKICKIAGFEKKEASVISSIGTLIYMTSPIAVFTLCNRIAVFDWVVIMMLPVIFGEAYVVSNEIKNKAGKVIACDGSILLIALISGIACLASSHKMIRDWDVLGTPIRFIKSFDLFPYFGTNNTDIFNASAIQLPFAFFMMLFAVIIITLAIGKSKNKTLYALMAVSFIAFIFSCFPVSWIALPNILTRLIGPVAMLVISQTFMVLSIPFFVLFVKGNIENKKYRLCLFAILVIAALISAMFNANNIAFVSMPIWI